MYLNKSKNGIGWYSKVDRNQKNEEVAAKYVNFVFKRGTEPEADAIKGELYFIAENGEKRKVYPYFNDYGDGRVEFRIMGADGEKQSNDVSIAPSELPFY